MNPLRPMDEDDAFAGGCFTLLLGLVFVLAALLFGVYKLAAHR